MNTVSYLSQYIFNPFGNNKDSLRENDFEDKSNEPSSIQDQPGHANNIGYENLMSLTDDIKPNDIERLEDIDSLNIIENIEKNYEDNSSFNIKSDIFHTSETQKSVRHPLKRILMSIVLFVPYYLIYKPFSFTWWVITLPISFI